MLIIVLLGLTPSLSLAGQWGKTFVDNSSFFSGPTIETIYATKDGGCIMAGTFLSSAWLLKLDSHGNIEWQKTYGGSSEIYSIRQASDGGYIAAGTSVLIDSGRHSDAWILKTDAYGNIQWQRTYGGSYNDSGVTIEESSNGGYLVGGFTFSFGSGGGDSWLVRLDNMGGVLWQKTCGDSTFDRLYSVVATPDGGWVAAGQTAGKASLLKLDDKGNVQWQKSYGSNTSAFARSVALTADNDYIVAGYTGESGAGGLDAWILRIGIDGTTKWQKTYGTKELDTANSILQTKDGGYLVSGSTVGTSENSWLLKFDRDGNLQWQKIYNGIYGEGRIAVASDQGYILAATTSSVALKLDINGDLPDCRLMISMAELVGNNASVTTIDTKALLQDTFVSPQVREATPLHTAIIPGDICLDGGMLTPSSASTYQYLPAITSTLRLDPASAMPIGVGAVAFDNYSSLSVHIGLPSFTSLVDIYLGFNAPSISPDLWIIKSDNTLQNSTSGLAKWKANVIGPVDESLFGTIQNSDLAKGLYNLYLAVTPAGNVSAYHLWTTSFFVSHLSQNDSFKEGELIVKFRPNTPDTTKSNIHIKYGSRIIKILKDWHYVKLRPDLSVEDAVKLYEADREVEYSEPNGIAEWSIL